MHLDKQTWWNVFVEQHSHTIGYWQIHVSKHIWHGTNYMVVPIPSFHLPHSMLAYKKILQLIETKPCFMARNLWGSFACYVWCLYWYKHLKMKLPHRLHKKTCTRRIYFYVAYHSVPYASGLLYTKSSDWFIRVTQNAIGKIDWYNKTLQRACPWDVLYMQHTYITWHKTRVVSSWVHHMLICRRQWPFNPAGNELMCNETLVITTAKISV